MNKFNRFEFITLTAASAGTAITAHWDMFAHFLKITYTQSVLRYITISQESVFKLLADLYKHSQKTQT